MTDRNQEKDPSQKRLRMTRVVQSDLGLDNQDENNR